MEKKNYFSPELEVVELEIAAPILEVSGGGISDDGSAQEDKKDPDPGSFTW